MSSVSTVTKLAYRAQHVALLANTTIMQEAVRLANRQPRPQIDRSLIAVLTQRRQQLHARDLQNVEDGFYPRQLLFDFRFGEFAKQSATLLRESQQLIKRKRAKNFRDVPAEAASYPAYYRRTFHWQTDGYFSERSAALYDPGVELLFRGTADVMRRQVLPPVVKHARKIATTQNGRTVRVADIACGTGRGLHNLAAALPTATLDGIDLSPHYVKHAQRQLEDNPLTANRGITVAAANAESMPWADATFDALTCVYLFHELPRAIRRRIIAEMYRVLQPGGILVIEDSAQISDSPALEPALRNFPVEFHEPFYDEYLDDDLAQICRDSGFTDVATECHLVSKVVIASKPARQ
jgi:SAM-dependent methyltransferase